MDDDEHRIRERAYRIWEEEGRPEGREHEHWHRARERVAGERSEKDSASRRKPASPASASPMPSSSAPSSSAPPPAAPASPAKQPVGGIGKPGPLPGVDNQRQDVSEPIRTRSGAAQAATESAPTAKPPAAKPPAKPPAAKGGRKKVS